MIKMIKKHWVGKYSLAQSYWNGYILIPIVLVLPLFPAFMGDASTMPAGLVWFSLIYWGALFFVNMFLIIGAFKSAIIYIENKKKKKQGSAWGRVAQVALVLGALGIVVEYLKTLAS